MTILINPQRQLPQSTGLEAAARDRIAADLTAVGVRAGGVLLVHSSLSALGHVPGGAETVIQGLLKALGSEGTLLFPTLSYEYVTPKNPVFDVRRTPSNIGVIPETFRKRPGSMRSIHPTHSVAGIGVRARELLKYHVLDRTPCGPNSPFHKLPHAHGQILMLGCGLEPNTSMHAIEEKIEPPYLFGPEIPYILVYPDGTSYEKIYTSHGFDGWNQRYDRIEPLFEAAKLRGSGVPEGALRRGPVLQAQVHLIEAEALWATALDTLRQDPFAFVERIAY